MSNIRVDLVKDDICKKYLEEKKSINQTSKELKASHTTISKRLRSYGIQIKDYKRFEDFSREFFVDQYLNKNKSASIIAKEIGSSEGAILNWLKKHNIIIRKRKDKIILLTETQKAYMAGIIDGEGCICIYKSNNRHILCVSFTSTDIRLINHLSKMLDWNFVKTKHKDKPWKTSYRLQAMDSRPERLLKDILSYLVIKKEQAKLALKFRDTYKIKYSQKLGLPKEIWDLREAYESKMHLLNKRGTSNK